MWTRNIERPGPAHAWVATLLVLGTWASAPAQEPPAREPVLIAGAPVSDVRDTAGIFSAEAVAKARDQLVKLERNSRLPVVIETLDSLGGEPVAQVATRHARREVGQGLYVLIAKREKKTEVLASREFSPIFADLQKQAILAAFNREFAREEFDEGLQQGVQTIETIVARAKTEGKLPVASATVTSTSTATATATAPKPAPSSSSMLVLRNQVRLTLSGARRIVEGAEPKAGALGIKVNIAVVDDGGHLITFIRMDGARPASGYTAITKATTAATFRQPTGPIKAPGAEAPDPLLNLSLQNAAAASGGKLTTLYGGVPVVVDGQVIGGVGVGGGSGEQDAIVARAGIDAFLADLQADANPGGK